MKKKKAKCEARTELCSNMCLARYGINGSEKEGKTFRLCIACMALLRFQGHKMKQV